MKHFYMMFLLVFIVSSAGAQSNSLVRGVYRTFDEFKAGIPTVVDSFYVDSVARRKRRWAGTYSVKPRYVQSNKLIKNIWGFCDGTTSFISFQADFFPLVVSENEISFEGYGIADPLAYSFEGMILDAMGVAVYSIEPGQSIPGDRVKYIVNPQNANVFSTELQRIVAMSFKERKFILYRATKKEINEPMVFSVNDSIIDNFLPGSYLDLKFHPSIKQINICFGKDFENCESILFTELIQYVECIYSDHSAENDYKFVLVSQSEGEHNSEWSYDVQSRRDKKQKRLGVKENLTESE